MKIGLMILLFACSILGQNQAPTLKKCDHQSNSYTRFIEHTRVAPPTKITQWDGVRGTAQFSDPEGIHILHFITDKDSVLSIADYQKRWYWIMYCDKDHDDKEYTTVYAYVITEVLPKQFKK